MTKTLLFLLAVLTIANADCFPQTIEPADTLKTSEFEFKGLCGHEIDEKDEHYHCLIGTGISIGHITVNIEAIVSKWIEDHPDAIVVPVYSYGPTMMTKPNSKQTYCWVMSDSDTLNLFLAKIGAVPTEPFQGPDMDKDLSEIDKMFFHPITYKERHIERQEYLDFFEKLSLANEFARNYKLGIYSA